jgi:hypothetical protein
MAGDGRSTTRRGSQLLFSRLCSKLACADGGNSDAAGPYAAWARQQRPSPELQYHLRTQAQPSSAALLQLNRCFRCLLQLNRCFRCLLLPACCRRLCFLAPYPPSLPPLGNHLMGKPSFA